MEQLKSIFEALYAKYNRREFVSYDPLIFLYDYPDKKDREIVALISSSLAYGRVAQILKSVESVIKPLGMNPHQFIMGASPEFFKKEFSCFKHRFTCSKEITALLLSIKRALKQHGSLEELFCKSIKKSCSMIEAQHSFTKYLNDGKESYLLPTPQKGSACKRLNLFLRWMVRKDEVDPGGWDKIPVSSLIVPLDTHMLKVAQKFDLTLRKHANLKTALEVTDSFKRINPEDPVKYDFAVTRPGILNIKSKDIQ